MFAEIGLQSEFHNSERLQAPNFAVLPSRAFLQDFTTEASAAQKRVMFQAMAFWDKPDDLDLHNFLSSLESAAQAGLDTRFTIDAYSEMQTNDQSNSTPAFGLWIPEHQRLTQHSTQQTLNRLDQSGVQVQVTNRPKKLKHVPVARTLIGRNHIKSGVIDDTAYIGGVNLTQGILNGNDYMVKIQNPKIAQEIVQHQEESYRPHKPHHIAEVDDRNILLFDNGWKGESVILDYAIHYMNNAQESIQFVSQWLPSGPFLDALQQALNRGVHVDIITNSSSSTNRKAEAAAHYVAKFGLWKKGVNQSMDIHLLNEQFTHAKGLIIDNEWTLIGSHNLTNYATVACGTQEIGLATTQRQIVRNISAYFDKLRNMTYEPNLS